MLNLELALYIIFVIVVLVNVVMLVFKRNLFKNCLHVCWTLGATAGIYALMGANYLSGFQLLHMFSIFSLFFVFIIMFPEEKREALGVVENNKIYISTILLIAIVLLVFFAHMVLTTDLFDLTAASLSREITRPEEIYKKLFSEYVLPVFLTATMLLMALVSVISQINKGDK